MNQNQILEDYFLINMEPKKNMSAYQLLSQTGVLFASNLNYRLSITDIQFQPISSKSTHIFFTVNAEIHDISCSKHKVIDTLEAMGSFSQIHRYLTNQFYMFCNQNELTILTFHDMP